MRLWQRVVSQRHHVHWTGGGTLPVPYGHHTLTPVGHRVTLTGMDRKPFKSHEKQRTGGTLFGLKMQIKSSATQESIQPQRDIQQPLLLTGSGRPSAEKSTEILLSGNLTPPHHPMTNRKKFQAASPRKLDVGCIHSFISFHFKQIMVRQKTSQFMLPTLSKTIGRQQDTTKPRRFTTRNDGPHTLQIILHPHLDARRENIQHGHEERLLFPNAYLVQAKVNCQKGVAL